MNADGSNPVNLLPGNSSGELAPHWSPDGKKIVFLTNLFELTTSNDLGTINPDGTGLTRLTSTNDNDVTPSYSPDGNRILFGRGSDVFVMNADGTNPVNLTPGGTLSAFSAVFTPDGKAITFAASDGGDTDIFRMNADGSNPVNLTSLAVSDENSPRTSPDGKTILFVSDRDGPSRDVFVMNADGSNAILLTPGMTGDNRGPDWEFVYLCAGRRATSSAMTDPRPCEGRRSRT